MEKRTGTQLTRKADDPSGRSTNKDELAMELIGKEIELEKYQSLELLDQLVQLYSDTIEYYETARDPTHYALQKRLHTLLVQPHIMKILRTNAPARKPNTARTQAYLAGQLMQHLPADSALPKEVTRLFSAHNSRTQKTAQEVLESLSRQERSLRTRLSLRTALSSPRSGSTLSTSWCESSSEENESKLTSRSPALSRNFESKLEEIMEQSYTQCTVRIADIKAKYLLQMEELGTVGALVQLVRAEMNRKMNQEINDVEMDAKLKRESRKQLFL